MRRERGMFGNYRPEGLASVESEKMRGSLGFDFIFYRGEYGQRQVACVEINGHNSGIQGARGISIGDIDSSAQMLARVRSHLNLERKLAVDGLQEYVEKRHPDWGKKLHYGVDPYIDRRIEYLERIPMAISAFENDEFLEFVSGNKLIQSYFIPEEYRPAIYLKGGQRSRSGFWLVKPVAGCRGMGIDFIKDEHLESTSLLGNKEYVVQEFLIPLGAQKASHELVDHPASMRYLTDFIVNGRDKVVKLYEFAYQRVSPNGYRNLAQGISFTDTFVVNLARNATPVAASEEELALARIASSEIILNLSSEFVRDAALDRIAQDLAARGIKL